MDATTQRSRRRTDISDKTTGSKTAKKRVVKKSKSTERSASRSRPSRATKPIKPRGKSRSVSRKSENKTPTSTSKNVIFLLNDYLI